MGQIDFIKTELQQVGYNKTELQQVGYNKTELQQVGCLNIVFMARNSLECH